MAALVTSSGMIAWNAGFLQMSTKAFLVGTLATPFPGIDDADWQWFSGGCLGDGGSAAIQPQEDMFNVDVDAKSMRRYEQDDQAFVFVFSNHSGVVGENIQMCLDFSFLAKE